MARTAGKYHQITRRRAVSPPQRRLLASSHSIKKLTSSARSRKYEFDIIAPKSAPIKLIFAGPNIPTMVPKAPLSFTAPVVAKKSKKPKAHKAKLVSNLLLTACVPLMAFVAYAGYGYYKSAHKLESKISENQSVLGDTTDQQSVNTEPNAQLPDNAKPSEKATHTGAYVPKNLLAPRSIKISSIGVSASFVTVGQTKSGAMGVPADIFSVGWYNKTSSPGDNTGVSVINGHVYGPTQPGVFANLKNIKVGANVEVTLVNGTKLSYKVIKKASFKAGEAQGEALSSVSNKPGLNIITCTGAIKGDEYQDRLVVYTERI